MSAVTVVAMITAKAGKEAETATLLQGLVRSTHPEPGCVRYALHRRQDDPSVFIFVERWRSAQDLQAHLGSAHIAAAMARKEELLLSLDIAVLDLLAAGDPTKESLS
jgi:quinol monooxygenase YgiN